MQVEIILKERPVDEKGKWISDFHHSRLVIRLNKCNDIENDAILPRLKIEFEDFCLRWFEYYAELDLGHLSCLTHSGNYSIILFSIFKTLLFKYGKWPSFIKTQVNGFPDTYPAFVRTCPDIWSPFGYLSGHEWIMTSHGQPSNELEVIEPWPITQTDGQLDLTSSASATPWRWHLYTIFVHSVNLQ